MELSHLVDAATAAINYTTSQNETMYIMPRRASHAAANENETKTKNTEKSPLPNLHWHVSWIILSRTEVAMPVYEYIYAFTRCIGAQWLRHSITYISMKIVAGTHRLFHLSFERETKRQTKHCSAFTCQRLHTVREKEKKANANNLKSD